MGTQAGKIGCPSRQTGRARGCDHYLQGFGRDGAQSDKSLMVDKAAPEVDSWTGRVHFYQGMTGRSGSIRHQHVAGVLASDRRWGHLSGKTALAGAVGEQADERRMRVPHGGLQLQPLPFRLHRRETHILYQLTSGITERDHDGLAAKYGDHPAADKTITAQAFQEPSRRARVGRHAQLSGQYLQERFLE